MSEKEKLKKLIAEYEKFRSSSQESDISEATIRSWIHKLLEIFGWDTADTSQVIQEKKLSPHEQKKLISINSTSSRPDYKLLANGKVATFLDAKNITVKLISDKSSAFQIKSYGWSSGSPCAFLTNFDELSIHDTTYEPNKEQNADYGRVYFKIDEYLDNFEIIEKHLSRKNVLLGELTALYEDASKSKRRIKKQAVDESFANKLSSFRVSLATNVLEKNPEIIRNDIERLSYIVQMLINRIIFIRVCEARYIEEDGLLLSFQKEGFWKNFKHSSYNDFYENYDGPLFLRNNILHDIAISDQVFDELLQELYYPSPYRFDVIPTSLLSDVYEIFLANRLVLKDGIIIEELKIEYSKSTGVVSTPQYLVQDLIKRTASREVFLKKNMDEFFDTKFLDFACGSGAFIIELFDYLQSILVESYLNNPSEKYEKYFFIQGNKATMTVDGKRALISNCIHGIDIDEGAVEVARMSLALKIIDDIEFHEDYKALGIKGYQILNKVGANIKYGNTLVSSDIKKEFPKISNKKNLSQLEALNIFDWECNEYGFGIIFDNNKGFDFIIGNPPYVEAKHITDKFPFMYDYLKSQYETFALGKVDLSIPFIERGVQLLNKKGKLGVIIQNRFFKADYGDCIRNFITERKYLSQVINFTNTDLFKGRTTYVSSIILDIQGTETICYSNIGGDVSKMPFILQALPSSEDHSDEFNCVSLDVINNETWSFESIELLKIKKQIAKNNIPYGKFGSIGVGIQVLLVSVYHITVTEVDENLGIIKGTSRVDKNIEIEIEACRSLVPNKKLFSFKKDQNETYAIFPYDIVDEKKSPILFDDFQKRFPLAAKYLKKHRKIIKEEIKDNKYERNDSQKWHLYTRESHIEKNYSKILIPMTANDVFASVTQSDFIYCDNSNVNFAVIPEKTEENLYAVAGIFNSTTFSVLARATANKQRGGYYKLNKQFIMPVLFPAKIFSKNKPLVKKIASLGKLIEELQSQYEYSTPRQQIQIKKELIEKWDKLDVAVYKAYELTKEQQKYFINEGRNVNRVQVLDSI